MSTAVQRHAKKHGKCTHTEQEGWTLGACTKLSRNTAAKNSRQAWSRQDYRSNITDSLPLPGRTAGEPSREKRLLQSITTLRDTYRAK